MAPDDGSSSPLQAFAEDPDGFVIGIVATWIVGGILMVGRQVVGAVLLAFDSVVFAFDSARVRVIRNLEAVAAPVLEAAAGIPAFYAGLIEPLGPLAPVVTVLLVAGSAYLTYRALVVAIKEIPVVGGVLEFLGVEM
jgi:hypothetical protein